MLSYFANITHYLSPVNPDLSSSSGTLIILNSGRICNSFRRRIRTEEDLLESTFLFFHYITAEQKKVKWTEKISPENEKIGLSNERKTAREPEKPLISPIFARFSSEKQRKTSFAVVDKKLFPGRGKKGKPRSRFPFFGGFALSAERAGARL